MVQTPVQNLTFEAYLSYSDGTDNRYELVDGELLLMTPATGQHERIATFLLIQLYLEIQRLNLDWQVRPSGTGVRITERRSRLPDLCVITREQEQAIQNQASILETSPLVVVEIVSPESINRDYRVKRTEYALAGVPEYWIIDPLKNKVSILALNEGFYDATEFQDYSAIISSTFPELKLSAQQILLP